MGGRRPPIAPLRGDSQKPHAPALWLGLEPLMVAVSGRCITRDARAVAEVKALCLPDMRKEPRG